MGWLRGPMLRNGLIAGLVATTTMNAGYAAGRPVRRNADGPLDYDDSNVTSAAQHLVYAVTATATLRWLTGPDHRLEAMPGGEPDGDPGGEPCPEEAA